VLTGPAVSQDVVAVHVRLNVQHVSKRGQDHRITKRRHSIDREVE